MWSLTKPDESICIGGTWRIPVAAGLLSSGFVEDLKDDGSFSEAAFAREYESVWGGGNANSFFSPVKIDETRVIEDAMWSKPKTEGAHRARSRIIMSYDVGRVSDDSSLIIMNLVPTQSSVYVKQVVNLFNFSKMHFHDQAILLKKNYMLFGAEKIVIDGNGLGIGLLDIMTMENQLPDGSVLPAFGVDPESDPKGHYKNFYRGKDMVENAIYIVKATASFNSEIASLTNTQIESHRLQFLIDDQVKYKKLQRTDLWRANAVSEEQKIKELQPFKLTKLLREEMLNMRQAGDTSSGTSLKRISEGMRKDMFSSLTYAVWYARKLELANRTSTGSLVTFAANTTKKGVGYDRNSGSVRDRVGGGTRKSFSRR